MKVLLRARVVWSHLCGFVILLCVSGSAFSESEAVKLYNQLYPDAPDLVDGYMDIGDTQYHYVTAGEGPLVILYHGFPSFWYIWKNQIAALSESYRVVAVDGLGSNLSGRPQVVARYGVARLADDLDQLAYQLEGEAPFVLVGHDWGGALSWAFAQRYPERVKKLIVLSAPPYNVFLDLLRNNEAQQKASTYVELLKGPVMETVLAAADSYLMWKLAYQSSVDERHLTVTEGALFRRALARPGALAAGINWYRANIPAFTEITAGDYWPAVDYRVEAPSMLIWGGRDKTFVPDFMTMLPTVANSVTVKIIPEAGHKPSLSHPDHVNRLLLAFLCDAGC